MEGILSLKGSIFWGTWVAQSVKRPAFDFGSGHDLRVVRSTPMLGSVLCGESAEDYFSLTLPLPFLMQYLSL